MITLATTNTLQGVAGSASAITASVYGLEISGAVETYKPLFIGQLANTVGILYTVPASTTALIKTISLANTTAGAVTATIYVNGTTAAFQQASIPIPGNGEAVWASDGWKVLDAQGNTLVASSVSVPNTRQVIAGTGLTGGGDLTSDRTFNVIANADGSIVANADDVQVGVINDTQHGSRGGGTLHPAGTTGTAGFISTADKTRLDNMGTASPPGTRQIIAGAGLTGGGDLSADRTLDVVANADGSLVVAANDVKVGVLATDAQHGVRGGGTQHAQVTTGVDGFMIAADKSKLDNVGTAAPPGTRTLTAGQGLTGGGDLTANRTFDVIANADGSIVSNANDIQVGVLATDAQHGTRGGGSLHPSATTTVAGFLAAADRVWINAAQATTILVTSNQYQNITCNGSTDDLANLNTLLGLVPDGSTLVWPPGTMLISGAVSVPGGKHLNLLGAGNNKTYWLTTNQTADFLVHNDWYQSVKGITFISPQTTIAAGSNGAVLPQGNIAVADTTRANPAGGQCYIASGVAGNIGQWNLVTYTGRSVASGPGNLTGCSGGTLAMATGGQVVFKTAGYAINSGSNTNVFIRDCGFNRVFNGWLNNGTLCGILDCSFADTINFSVQFNGTNVNGLINNITSDGIPNAVAHVEVNQCGSLLIANSDLIRGVNNLRVNPTSPNGAFSLYCSQTFFDTAAGSGAKIMGTGNVQRLKFVNCWFSGAVIHGLEINGTGATLPTAVDVVNCDIFSNGNSGVRMLAGQDMSLSNCRIAGNANAGVQTTASAGSVTSFNIQNCRIGPTAGIGANAQGVLVNAGTYASYNITGNDVSNNTSSLNITDNGSVASSDLRIVSGNNGHLKQGALSSLAAPLSIPVTTETLILNARIPANAVQVGQVFRVRAVGVAASTNVCTWRVRIGAVGTVAGDTVIAYVAAGAAQAANTRCGIDVLVTIRSVGAGSLEADGYVSAATALAAPVGAAATGAVTTTAAWFIDLSMSQTISTSLIQHAVIEAL